MSRPVTPALSLPARGSRPNSAYGADSHIPGVANVDHLTAGNNNNTYLSGGLGDADSVRDGAPSLLRSNSQMSQSATYVPSRGGTLKKKASIKRGSSLKRSGSRKSSYAGSVRSLRVGEKEQYEPEEYNSAFYCPVPTTGSPTDLLSDRFQVWRRVLKDLINYFRDLHKSYDTKSKSLLSASNVINNTAVPAELLASGGLGDATALLREFHNQALTEAQKARDLENEVILQLTGLRSDLSQKIKEIKSLSGDFKNSVGKEQDGTRKAVNAYQEALGMVDRDASVTAGKGDPFIQKMSVERQLDRQIEEENYLHRAYLNLEASGRELESIVVGEIQKAYQVLAGILKREADNNYETAERLREGPLTMAKDVEWDAFVTDNENMVDPRQPLRKVNNIVYPGKNHPAGINVRSGMLERKSKYLKNYTPGWYILSPTHIHEYKSADGIPYQQPIMSLYLPEQKLGSHSEVGSSSNKFMLKGRQTGGVHRGHTWIFRAESHDTMMAWYADLKELTEKRGEARNEFVRRTHARSVSGGSHAAPSVGSGESQLMEEDEADRVAFSTEQSIRGAPVAQMVQDSVPVTAAIGAEPNAAAPPVDDGRSEAGWRPPQQRPQPGGRFPSQLDVNRSLQAPLSPSSGNSDDEHDRDAIAQASTLPGSDLPFVAGAMAQPHIEHTMPSKDEVAGAASAPTQRQAPDENGTGVSYTAGQHARVDTTPAGAADVNLDTQSTYKEWMGTMGAVAAVDAVGGGSAPMSNDRSNPAHSASHRVAESSTAEMDASNPAIPARGHSSAPMVAEASVPPPHASPQQISESQESSALPSYSADLNQAVAPMPPPVISGLIAGTDIRSAPQTKPAGSIHTDTISPISPVSTLASTIDTNIAASPTPALHYSTTSARDNAVAAGASRPNPVTSRSEMTISDLHVPGEYPNPKEGINKLTGAKQS